MLDNSIQIRIRRLSAAETRAHGSTLTANLLAAQSRFNARGVLRSSMFAQAGKKVAAENLTVRAKIIWESIVRVLRIHNIASTPELASDLRAIYRSLLETQLTEINASLHQQCGRIVAGMSSNIQGLLSLDVEFAHHIEQYDVEIDLFCDGLIQGQEIRGTGDTYIFNAALGAFQTGDHANANVVQNVSNEHKTALIVTLRDVGQAIREYADFGDDYKRELLEIVADGEAELKEEQPNQTRFRSAMQTIGSTLRGMATASGVYSALKSALNPFNIFLP